MFWTKKRTNTKPFTPADAASLRRELGDVPTIVMLEPAAFARLQEHSLLKPAQWYKALYLIQEKPTQSVQAFRGEVGVSWKTAETMRAKLREAIAAQLRLLDQA